MSKIPVKIREVEAVIRSKNFDEVVSGYSEKEALEEASRCLQCKNPTCIEGCPVGIDIKKFIYELSQNRYDKAYATIREKNDFPSICGRVCPAEYQCRKACVLTKKGSIHASANAINIHFLERFIGDHGMKHTASAKIPLKTALSGRRVAVIGSGPAGLACAGELARNEIKITVFEALHKLGGVLRYGIPPFRLPRNILDYEIDYLKKLGVEFTVNNIIGKTETIEELFDKGFDAVFLGLGAGTPSFLGIEGENLCNVYSANEFLTRLNLMQAYKFPEYHTPVTVGKHMVVIGGGNTAIDAARTALRLQNTRGLDSDTSILYRRTEAEMPARRLEIEHAREEGVRLEMLIKPIKFIGDEKGFLKKIVCQRCRLSEPDRSGRPRPVPIEGSDFEADCDVAVIAIGLNANRVLTDVTPSLKLNEYSDIVVDNETMQTSIDGVFAGGDIVGGEGTVIEAMGMAKKASRAIMDYLSKR